MFASISAGLELLIQLTEAAVLLMLLDRLASAIRLTYKAGRLCGRLWYGYGLPALLASADGISWLAAQVDWPEVFVTVRHGLAVLVALAITAAQASLPALCVASERLGKAYARLLIGDASPAAVVGAAPISVPPLVHPLTAVADELMVLTRSELMFLVGCRRRLSKAQLIGMALTA